MANKISLSVVITTKNESANIANCIHAFDGFPVEIIVVDNESSDDTKQIAARLGAKVLDKGPERSAQRNLGWQTATGEWVLILDADMIMPKETIEEILEIAGRGGVHGVPALPSAYWIPEVRTGTGFRTKCRNFERSFYDGTCVDALRLFHKSVLEATGGYDEGLIAGPEDWDLDLRVLGGNFKCGVLKHHLIHNEKQLSLKRMLEKKAYYTKSFAAYQAKWPNHPAVRRQFSPVYRFFTVFVEQGKWRKICRHPILFAGVIFERVLVGVTYLLNR